MCAVRVRVRRACVCVCVHMRVCVCVSYIHVGAYACRLMTKHPLRPCVCCSVATRVMYFALSLFCCMIAFFTG